MMKKTLLTFLFGLIIYATGFSQEDSIITIIRDDFQKWQPIIEKKFDNCDKLYNYAWGENYQFDKWTDKKLNDDTLTLSEAVSIIEQKDLGFFVHVDTYSFSGDWYIATDYYYNKDGQLYFVFWRMNTFYAEEPLTVEKRLYFDTHGQLIRDLKSVFKMNTKKKIDIGFMDREVDYDLTLSDMNFYKHWIDGK
ncbi:MAG: hypothetical protein RBS07_08785 [Lentimicrobium sp.]|jgi:hypothetical protein|nr:hypothetical protein [Lentimicrobium sp.]